MPKKWYIRHLYYNNHHIKQLNKVNKIHEKIKNQRLDYLHKLSNQITEVKFVSGARDFRLMKREMVNAILSLPEAVHAILASSTAL